MSLVAEVPLKVAVLPDVSVVVMTIDKVPSLNPDKFRTVDNVLDGVTAKLEIVEVLDPSETAIL